MPAMIRPGMNGGHSPPHEKRQVCASIGNRT